jgi:hypothetical protein
LFAPELFAHGGQFGVIQPTVAIGVEPFQPIL